MSEKVKETFDAKNFTKTFIQKLFINFIWVGVFSYILLEIAQEFLPKSLRLIVVIFLLYIAIKKIHLAAISETFMLGKINPDDINRIVKNIIIVYCVLFLVGTFFAVGNYLISFKTIENLSSSGMLLESITGSKEVMKSNAMHNLLYSTILQLASNGVLAFLCVKKLKKESSKPENLS